MMSDVERGLWERYFEELKNKEPVK